MERAAWTDERLDDRMSATDTSFERVFEEMRAERAEFRADMKDLRAEIRAEMHAGFADVHARFAETRADTLALHRQMAQILTGLAMALIGALAAAIVAAF